MAIPLSTLFTYSDADGLADIVKFDVQDRTAGGGYLTLNGVKQAENTVFEEPIGQIGQWAFVVGPSGSDVVGFNAIDSQGAFNPSVTATVTAQASADVVLDTTATAYSLTIGGTIGNTIDPTAMAGSANTAFDHDWFKVNLTAGHSYHFAAQGTSCSLDVVAIQLNNSAGAAVPGTLEDNSVPLDYTAASSDAYYLAGSGKPPATLITAKAVRHINGKRSDASVG
jgi:hypothetical protein